MGAIRDFMEKHYLHFNARETVDAAKAYVSRLIATAMRVGPGALMPDHLAAAASITAAPTGGGR